jgi:methylated-DNA-[protein]-cysteine S-methyltransferase
MSAGLDTPLGPVSVTEAEGLIMGLDWREGPPPQTDLWRETVAQLRAYFAGKRVAFELPLDFGAGFQAQVRRAMAAIPFGETRTYGALAHAIGAPAQAIGQACGANPLPILIPCHRILGAKGLGGFSAKGGVETKVWLLRHEGAAGLLI